MKAITLIFSLLILFVAEPSFAMSVVANSASLPPQINNQESEPRCEDKDGNLICPQ
ncbi:hypothetical protein [Oscillatoria salina]|uniref:hypothetical protein n=1 Tax=Oscillatoria salina TaxID=331517 RepID=UPI0013B9DA5A|nr:hypothetical protein [Oscillatoria salina]MBZ8178901.1 hypothetical protein [Oscillatoria salina IIICB1]NET86673.1 hypothetical protein [Kamptonema sp. SIO1D9]